MATDRARVDIWKLRLLQFLYYSSFCFFLAYYTVYLIEEIGVSPAVVGTIASVSAIVTFLSQNFWGGVCDKLGSPRPVLLCLYLTAGGLILAFSFVKSTPVLLAIILLKAFFEPPIVTLNDSWGAQFSADKNRAYGSIRAYGSLGITVVGLMMFIIHKRVDIPMQTLFRGYPILFAISFVIALTIEYRPAPHKRVSFIKAVPMLIKNRDYVVFLLSLSLVMMAFNMVTLFQANTVKAAGGGLAEMCLPWCFSGGSEIPILFLARRLQRRFGIEKLLVFSFAMFILRVTLMTLANKVWLVYAANALNGITFGIALPIIVTYVTRISPEGFKASGLTMCNAIYASVAGCVGSLLSGWITEIWSIRAAGATGVALCAIGFSIFTLYHLRKGDFAKTP